MSDLLKPSEILKRAREIISDPLRWTKGAFARDPEGFDLDSEEAYSADLASCSFCSIGAVKRAMGPHASSTLYELEKNTKKFLYKSVFGPHVSTASFNDSPSTTHQDVMAAFDRAIAEAESSE